MGHIFSPASASANVTTLSVSLTNSTTRIFTSLDVPRSAVMVTDPCSSNHLICVFCLVRKFFSLNSSRFFAIGHSSTESIAMTESKSVPGSKGSSPFNRLFCGPKYLIMVYRGVIFFDFRGGGGKIFSGGAKNYPKYFEST